MEWQVNLLYRPLILEGIEGRNKVLTKAKEGVSYGLYLCGYNGAGNFYLSGDFYIYVRDDGTDLWDMKSRRPN